MSKEETPKTPASLMSRRQFLRSMLFGLVAGGGLAAKVASDLQGAGVDVVRALPAVVQHAGDLKKTYLDVMSNFPKSTIRSPS